MDAVMDNLIEIRCEIPAFTTKLDIIEMLPKWQTKVEEINSTTLKLKVKASSVEEIQKWIKAYEAHTYTTYTVRSTDKCGGKLIQFKQRLRCHRNTISILTASEKKGIKNTNCPSNMTVKLRRLNSNYRGKDKSKAPDKLMPCEIVLFYNHNHLLLSAESLRFRKVCPEVQEELIRLFRTGHSPVTALEMIKTEINLTNDIEKLADRKFFPDYNYSYQLYLKEMQNNISPPEDWRDSLNKLIEDYNMNMNEVSAKSVNFESDYVVCICPPLFRRVHEYSDLSSEIAFLDSCGSLTNKGNKVFILLTHSECGGLPLGVFILSSENPELISTGFKLLKEIMGNDIFGGYTDGPKLFLSHDSASEQLAIQENFLRSTHLLSTFHVLQSVMKWLVKTKNGIKREDQLKLFHDFKKIMYANTINDCQSTYDIALENASIYPNYCEYLKSYWEKRNLWVLILRAHLDVSGHNTNHFSEAAMRVLKDKLFHRIQAFNLLQLVDFIMKKFVQYFEKRIMDASVDSLTKNLFGYKIPEPPQDMVSKIQTISESFILVPNENNVNEIYVVNTDILLCTCAAGKSGRICKHIHWACSVSNSIPYLQDIDSLAQREKFYLIATGCYAPEYCLTPLCSESSLINIEENLDINDTEENTYQNNSNDVEWALHDGKKRFEQISTKFLFYLEKDPESVQKALETMEKNLEKLPTVSSFCSACATFGSDNTIREEIIQSSSYSEYTLVDGRGEDTNEMLFINK